MKIYRNFIVYYMQNTGLGKRKWRLLCVWTSRRRTPFSQRITPTVPLTSHIGFDQEKTSVNSERDWWMEPWTFQNDLKGLQRNVDLALFLSTTNLVEYQNQISKINIKILITAVQLNYISDINIIYKTLAAGNGIGAGPSLEERKVTNSQRKSSRRNKRPRMWDELKEVL